MELVFVYLGSKVPEYLIKNISQVTDNFPSHRTVLLSDSQEQINDLRDILPHVKFHRVSNPEYSWSKTLSDSGFPANFRDNFWGKTLARFYSIYEYMSINPDQPILHIEGDIWLSPRFPLLKISAIDKALAYPLTNSDQGVASTIFFKNFDSAKMLKNFSEQKMSQDNLSTDVSVLGAIYKAHPDEILILPTSPSEFSHFHPHADQETRLLMSEKFGDFGGIFDASTWGQFLTGEDAKNNVGVKKVYHHQKHHAVCPRNYRFTYSRSAGLWAESNKISFEIFSLHVHSKNNKIFSTNTSDATIANYSSIYAGRERNEFILAIFIKQVPSFLLYRIKLLVRKALGRV